MKKYKIKYLKDGVENGIILELDTFDKSKLPQNIIDIKEVGFSFDTLFKKRIKQKDMILLFYELNLMLQANIPFNETINILLENKKDKNIVEFLNLIKISFSTSKPIDEVLADFSLDSIVISFLRICQESGNIKENIQALSKLLSENDKLKKSFFKSISYPIILVISFFISLICIFYFVVPKFMVIFSQFHDKLPLATKALLYVQNIFENYLIFVFGIFVLVLVFSIYLFKKNENLNFLLHKYLVKKIFIIKDVFLNIELYKLFFVLSILLDSKYEFHKALNYSKVLLKNKYLLDKITLIESLLYNGKQIKTSFSQSGIFDDIILNLISTGEVSNSLPVIVGEIKDIYKNRFYNTVNTLTNLIQPVFLVLMMSLILWLMLAIFIPIWDMGNMIKI